MVCKLEPWLSPHLSLWAALAPVSLFVLPPFKPSLTHGPFLLKVLELEDPVGCLQGPLGVKGSEGLGRGQRGGRDTPGWS